MTLLTPFPLLTMTYNNDKMTDNNDCVSNELMFDIPGGQMVNVAIAQASALEAMELAVEAPPVGNEGESSYQARDVSDTVPSPPVEGTVSGAPCLDDGVLHLAIAARALRRVWRRLCPSDLDYFDLTDLIRSARSMARWLEERRRVTKSRKWKAWIAKSVQDGGRNILQWVG